jgi:hypothetical protein
MPESVQFVKPGFARRLPTALHSGMIADTFPLPNLFDDAALAGGRGVADEPR